MDQPFDFTLPRDGQPALFRGMATGCPPAKPY